MLKLLKKETHTPQTERIYKVPLCIQDTIPIYRIAENGICELEKPTSGSKKGIHQFDRMYLFEDINFSTQDEEEKEDTCSKFETLLRSMNVSYKIIVSNHYADNNKLREEILQKAVSKEMEPLAKEYHKMIGERLEEGRGGLLQSKYFVVSCRKPDYESAKTYFNTIEFSIQQLFHRLGSCLIPLDATERLRALHSYYRMGEEASFSFDWNEYLHLKRDWRNDIINTSLREKPEHLEMEGGTCACVMFVRKYPNGLTDQFLNELTNMNFPIIYTMDVEPLDNNVAYQMIMKKYMANERSINREQEMKNKNGDYSTAWEKGRQVGRDSWAVSGENKTVSASIKPTATTPLQPTSTPMASPNFDKLLASLETGKKASGKSKVLDLSDTPDNLSESSAYSAITQKLKPREVSLLPESMRKVAATVAVPLAMAASPATAGEIPTPNISDAYNVENIRETNNTFTAVGSRNYNNNGRTYQIGKVCDEVVIHVANTDRKGSETIRAEILGILEELSEG